MRPWICRWFGHRVHHEARQSAYGIPGYRDGNLYFCRCSRCGRRWPLGPGTGDYMEAQLKLPYRQRVPRGGH